MAGIFKAYDVRGTYPDQIDEEIVRKIGRSFALLLDQQTTTDSRKVVVGHDMRSHSAPLCEALLDGLHTSGIDTIEIGLTTTPMNYFAVGKLQAAGGIQVTASHNPAKYNGLKFSLHEARPVSGDDGIHVRCRAAGHANHLNRTHPFADQRPGQVRRTGEIVRYAAKKYAHGFIGSSFGAVCSCVEFEASDKGLPRNGKGPQRMRPFTLAYGIEV